jgi:predicted Zn finger-like uncharacterized protein
MPELIACPSCRRSLRISDDLLGELVKCPSCGTEFTAASGSSSPPVGEVNPRGEIVRHEPAHYGVEDDYGDHPRTQESPSPLASFRREEDAADAPRSPSVRRDREEDDERPHRSRHRSREWEEDEDYPFRGRHGYARSQVGPPGTALQVVGIISLVLAVLGLGLNLLGVGLAANQGNPSPGDREEMIVNLVTGSCQAIVGILIGAVITAGGTKMKRLENYGLAMTASILAMIPCTGCCLLTLPFGIWSLVVINRPEVRDAFH